MPIVAEWSQIIDDYALHLVASDRSPNTIRARREQLAHMARRIGMLPDAVRAPHLLRYVGAMDWSTETRRSRYAGLREFYKWAKRNGYTLVNPAKQLPRVKAATPNPDPVPAPVYEASQRSARVRGDKRAEIMLRLAYDHGLRRSEIAVGHSEDLRQDLLGWSLLVHGKGRKVRIVPLTPRMALELRALGPGHFFPGKIDGHLSPRRVGEVLRDSIDGNWTGHKLRHAFGTNVHEATNGDVMTAGKLLGHANLSASQHYIRPADARLRAAVYAAAGYAPPDPTDRKLVAV
ncbi:tyrosine-type recombinase/integrase [Microbacterium sp. Mcb102]|uniref:tyrosine-type recombinase/integrase n=1 Tax=Microbacterium sp. Mcb102 TaxID=2926012 RepID=UPI0021C9F472|nr:tyrosine-type recombinase/integrase [Microbacterium sp. Mcb102]